MPGFQSHDSRCGFPGSRPSLKCGGAAAQSCLTLVTPWTVACQAPLSVGFPTGVGCHALLQGIFLTQGSNPGLLHCRWFFTD